MLSGHSIIPKIDRMEKQLNDLYQAIHSLTLDSRKKKPDDKKKIAAFHATVIASKFSFLPCSSLECLVELENLVKENNIAVSLIVHFQTELIHLKTANQFVTACIELMISDELAEDLQWKTGERVCDLRPGISGLTRIHACIGGKKLNLNNLYCFENLKSNH